MHQSKSYEFYNSQNPFLERKRCASPVGVPVLHVRTSLADLNKTQTFEYAIHLNSRRGWKLFGEAF